ncbi:hypothetical protein BRAS3843_1070097 [Bradyrhizobium sp. STM 3843]|nr:hypothetical protein BRAS3843_1070097 [Bradyrhizobium sp. STM 3843]
MPAPPYPHQDQRRQRVELNLQRQRPQMQQRQLIRAGREIVARFPPILDVGDREQPVCRLLCQLAHGFGRQKEPADGEARRDRHDQRREDAPRPPQIEVGQREALRRDVAQNLSGYQIAGDDEEDVDAGKAGLEARDPQMEQNDDDDGDRPEGIDIGTMTASQCSPPRVFFEAHEMHRHGWQQRETVMTSSDPSGDVWPALGWQNCFDTTHNADMIGTLSGGTKLIGRWLAPYCRQGRIVRTSAILKSSWPPKSGDAIRPREAWR